VSRCQSRCLSSAGDVMTSQFLYLPIVTNPENNRARHEKKESLSQIPFYFIFNKLPVTSKMVLCCVVYGCNQQFVRKMKFYSFRIRPCTRPAHSRVDVYACTRAVYTNTAVRQPYVTRPYRTQPAYTFTRSVYTACAHVHGLYTAL